MIKSQHWTQHSLYQKNLLSSLKSLLPLYRDRIEEYSELIDKLFYFNLDPAYNSYPLTTPILADLLSIKLKYFAPSSL